MLNSKNQASLPKLLTYPNTLKGIKELSAYSRAVLTANQWFCAYPYYCSDGISMMGF